MLVGDKDPSIMNVECQYDPPTYMASSSGRTLYGCWKLKLQDKTWLVE